MMEGCMVLDFYYFSYQCLLNDNMIRLLNEYRDKIDINLYDISNNHLLAGEMKMFFPTLIVLDKKKDTIVRSGSLFWSRQQTEYIRRRNLFYQQYPEILPKGS